MNVQDELAYKLRKQIDKAAREAIEGQTFKGVLYDGGRYEVIIDEVEFDVIHLDLSKVVMG